METTFILKQMQNVIKTYTDQQLGLPLTKAEEQKLLDNIIPKVDERGLDHFRDIVHDVIYTFFTDQEDD
ncbi:YqzH family protein [Halalkalibacter lacteus]|uniref:YqzH family protein n=1 Tax=Halalkalibacter lacteus TaxID=3090663 RepID=UPI002FC88751